MSTLAKRWREAREDAGLKMNELDRAIGQGPGGYTTRIESGDKTNPALDIIEKAAAALSVRPAWLAFGDGPKRDLAYGTLLADVKQRPELHKLLKEQPTRWKLGTVVRALAETFQSDSLGRPMSGGRFVGWEDLLDGIESGKLDARESGSVRGDTKRQIGRRPKLPAAGR